MYTNSQIYYGGYTMWQKPEHYKTFTIQVWVIYDSISYSYRIDLYNSSHNLYLWSQVTNIQILIHYPQHKIEGILQTF